jgi:hypothetical protein
MEGGLEGSGLWGSRSREIWLGKRRGTLVRVQRCMVPVATAVPRDWPKRIIEEEWTGRARE